MTPRGSSFDLQCRFDEDEAFGETKAGRARGGTSWSSGEDDTAGEARTTADELHGVESQKHPTFRGHPGSGHATPKDEQRRNLRALRKLKDAEPEPEPPAHHSPAVDPLVMRKIQTDLDKLARRKNERERSRRRVRAREEKDSDRGASRLTGAGVNERIVRTPLVVSGVDAETSTPTASMRKDAVGNTAYETPSTRDAHASRGERSHKAQSPVRGLRLAARQFRGRGVRVGQRRRGDSGIGAVRDGARQGEMDRVFSASSDASALCENLRRDP